MEGQRGRVSGVGCGTMVEPWWNRNGTLVEPRAFLVEPRFSAVLAPCVFAHFACVGPPPTTSFIILKGDLRATSGVHAVPLPFLEFYSALF